MARELDELEAQITALTKTLDELDRSFKDGLLDASFHFRRRVALVRDHELALKSLGTILTSEGADEMSAVLIRVQGSLGDKAGDQAVEQALEEARESGSKKSWGHVLNNALDEHRGSIVSVAVSAALKVARFLVLA